MTFLILDIETATDRTIWTPPDDAPLTMAPIAAHQVIAIGCLLLDENFEFLRLGLIGSGKSERERIEALSLFVADKRPVIVTYNGRGFDLPVILARALHRGVSLGWYYNTRDLRHRYSEAGHLDLCDWLSDHGAARMGKLEDFARLIGMPGKLGMDGSQVDEMYRAGKLAEIETYCLGDVVQTAFLFLRFRLLQGRISLAEYRNAACSLVEAVEKDGRAAEVIKRIDESRLFVGAAPGLEQGAA